MLYSVTGLFFGWFIVGKVYIWNGSNQALMSSIILSECLIHLSSFPSHNTHKPFGSCFLDWRKPRPHTLTLTILIFLEPSILHRFWTCANCTADQGKQNMLCRMQLVVSEGWEARRTFSAPTFPLVSMSYLPTWPCQKMTHRVRWSIYHWFD